VPREGRIIVAFASKLKELRQQRDISLRKLGEKAGISYSILNAIENGRYQPTRETVISLAYALKHEDVEELLVLAGCSSAEEQQL
jgi:transcriptional regulator with XRE-family HTH domain